MLHRVYSVAFTPLRCKGTRRMVCPQEAWSALVWSAARKKRKAPQHGTGLLRLLRSLKIMCKKYYLFFTQEAVPDSVHCHGHGVIMCGRTLISTHLQSTPWNCSSKPHAELRTG